jgi:Tfp pilus assembly protein FimT
MREAFTTVEIVIVITIIAIISVLAVVSFSTISPKRLEAEARKIISDLCWVREMAVAGHQNYFVVFDTLNEQYEIYRGSINPNNQVKFENLEVDLVSVTPAPAQLQFSFPLGTTQSKQINLSYQGRAQQVRVFGETGYVRME